MDRTQRKEGAHRVSVAGNTAAGVAGGAFGAAKLRDSHKEQYGDQHVKRLARVAGQAVKPGARGVKVAHLIEHGKPGFKTLAVGAAAGGLAATTRRLESHLERKERLGKSAFGVNHGEVAKFHESPKKHERELVRRVKTAASPPAPVRKPVESAAIRSMGYQRQTRRMDVEFHSRPGRPYSYRMPPKDAKQFTDAPSKGKHYTGAVKGKYPHKKRTTPVDRVRLFANPDVSKSLSAFGVNHGARLEGTAAIY